MSDGEIKIIIWVWFITIQFPLSIWVISCSVKGIMRNWKEIKRLREELRILKQEEKDIERMIQEIYR